MNKPPIFILGMPRAGTTLMRYCLNQHSRIYIAPESNFMRMVYGNRLLLPEYALAKNADKIVKKMMLFQQESEDMHLMKEFFYLEQDLQTEIKHHAYTYKDVATIVFSRFATEKGKVRWGEKTPTHIFYLDQIWQLFPTAKIINMTRNPKNMIASNFKSSHIYGDFIKNCLTYKKCLEYSDRYQDHILTIKYENLTNNPQQTLTEVCNYIEEEFEEKLLYPGMMDSSYNSNSIVHDQNIGIKPDNPNKWQKVLTAYQSDFIDYLFNEPEKVSVKMLKDRIKLSQKELYFQLQLNKNRWGLENLKRIYSNNWDWIKNGKNNK